MSEKKADSDEGKRIAIDGQMYRPITSEQGLACELVALHENLVQAEREAASLRARVAQLEAEKSSDRIRELRKMIGLAESGAFTWRRDGDRVLLLIEKR